MNYHFSRYIDCKQFRAIYYDGYACLMFSLFNTKPAQKIHTIQMGKGANPHVDD